MPAGMGGTGQVIQGKGGDVARGRGKRERGRRNVHFWQEMYRSTGNFTRRGERTPIRFGSYDIRNGQNGCLKLALRGASQANLDLGVLQETNIMYRVYTRDSYSYSIVTVDVPSRHLDQVAVFYQASLWFTVEAIYKFVPNVDSFQMATGEQQLCIIGCYLAPDYASMIERFFKALVKLPKGYKLVGAVYSNADLAQPE